MEEIAILMSLPKFQITNERSMLLKNTKYKRYRLQLLKS